MRAALLSRIIILDYVILIICGEEESVWIDVNKLFIGRKHLSSLLNP